MLKDSSKACCPLGSHSMLREIEMDDSKERLMAGRPRCNSSSHGQHQIPPYQKAKSKARVDHTNEC
jgi:hypothetical protein